MKLELQRADWYKVFYNSSSTECWGKFKETINNLKSKFVPLQKQTQKKTKKQIYMDEETLPPVLENERPTRLPNVC